MRIALKTGYFTIVAILGFGLALGGHSWAQDAPVGGVAETSDAKGDVLIATLEIGLLDGSPQVHEIGPVSTGPPTGEPTYLEIGEITVGILVGLLDRDQQVVEVHLFKAAGEPMAQLLIEPDVTGYADPDESTSLEVRLIGLREGTLRSGARDGAETSGQETEGPD